MTWRAVATLMALVGPGGGLFAGRAQEPQVFPSLPEDAPAGSGAVEPCRPPGVDGPARCGVFRVWEDREAQGGRTLDVAFVVLDALDGDVRRPDPVVLLPGGPGQSFVDAAGSIGDGYATPRRERDILLVDVRGVGRSGGLSCDVPSAGGIRARFGSLFPVDHAVACRDALEERARLDLYTTALSVDDIEDVRRWLGYPSVNLDGTSYGTRVAQVYMRRHPDAVRTAVLNGVAPVSEPLYVTHAALLQRALDDLVAECAGQEGCRRRYPGLREDVDGLLARFVAGPVTVEVRGDDVPFHLGDLAYALRGLLYGRGRELPKILTGAAAGDVGPLAEYFVERTDWLEDPTEFAGYHFSVLCAEDIAPVTDDMAATATAGTFMGEALIGAYRDVCGVWPYARLPARHWEPVRADIPTLLLSGSRDPVTPPEAAQRVAEGLTRSLHVVVPGGGHGVWGPCLEEMVLELWRTASPEGLDPTCVAAAPATGFTGPGG